ncbi:MULTISPECIES: histidinol-phosphatase [Cupriavidus]|uniref:Histidinol-phosphatase n=1 Tax=Cupriavidus pinatubonensis (strain JMP 134 / LMG 1197) TaxID=264198 RepID=Q470P9_CUPPJ|nr:MULTISPECIES: histidinol-phosphatase [Cupriavidus]QYY29987.1 histidinol-phosphatase [Cupriavidus pinatubonensis]
MSMHADQQSEYLAFAGRLADAASAVTLPYFRAPISVVDKGTARFDPVTVADREAELAMRALIRSTYPAHGILGEEEQRITGTDPHHWVLDPIDGTRAFITGLPLWGTLIALNDGQRPVLGVMDQPFTRERFSGDRERAWLNGNPLQVRPCAALSEATLLCTTPDMFESGEQWDAFQRVARAARMQRYGGDCYGYCMVAAGQVDAVVEAGLQPYDVQALIPIVEGAGGIMTSWTGGDPQHGGAVVACGDARVHAEILRLLNSPG